MAAKKLGKYILDHDDKTYFINGNNAHRIIYSNNEVIINNENKSEILERNHHKYVDFKFSFDELNFTDRDNVIEKLDDLIEDISKIEINNPKKSSWIKQFDIPENYDELDDIEKKRYINNIVNNYFGNDDKGIPEIVDYKIDINKKRKEILKVKLRRTYDRKISLDDSLISIHTKAGNDNNFEEYKIKPHIHIIIDKNKALGKDFSKLRKDLYDLFKKHELTASNNTYIQKDRNSEEYKEYRILKDRLSSFSWVISKHEEKEYIIKQLNQYNRNSKCVKLDNIEEKLNRYLKLDGSYDFARKIQINLKEKLDIDIELKAPKSYLRAEKNIQEGNYKEIITEVRNQALNGEKISEKYKEYAIEILQKDNVDIRELATAKAIKEVIKNRGFTYNKNYSKVIDEKKINAICDNYIERVSNISSKEMQNIVYKKIIDKNYIDQEDLRKDLRKAEIKNIKETIGLSEVKIIFEGTEKYIKDNLKFNNKNKSSKDIKEQIKEMNLNISEKWISQITYKIQLEENINWKNINTFEDINKNIEIENLDISDKQLLNIGKSVYNEKYIKVKEEIKGKIDYTTIKPINAYKNIKKQIEGLEVNISDNWKENITNDIYKEKGYKDKNKEQINDKLNRVYALKDGYNSVKDGCKKLNNKLKEVSGKDRDTVSKEIENVKNETKEIFVILRQLEVTILTLSNNTKYNNNDTQNIDDLLSSHEKILKNYQEKMSNLKTQINQMENKKEKPIKVNENKINNLQNEIENLNIEEDKLIKTSQKLYKAENNILKGYTLQHYENEIKAVRDKIKTLEKQKEQIKKKGVISKLFKKQESVSGINKRIEAEQIRINNYQEKIDKVKTIRKDKNKINKMNSKINQVKKLKNKELKQLREILNLNKKKKKNIEREF